MGIAVLMTCHNRKEMTLRCLRSLAGAIGHLLTREDYAAMGEACRHRVKELYTEEQNYTQLMGIYSRVEV